MKKIKFLLAIAMYAFATVTNAQDASFYKKYAEKGDVEAIYNLASCYLNGTGGVEQDYSSAAEWMAKAVKKKYAPAQHMMGLMYNEGAGVLKDSKMAMDLLQKACNQNYAPAMYSLGMQYYQSGSYSIAKNYLEKAAEAGDEDALYVLGYGYLYGDKDINLEIDVDKAATYLYKAADKGHREATGYLGLLYENGLGVDQNFKLAAMCYQYAAEDKNNSLAQLWLGNCYLSGNGVDQNNSEALRFLC